jgi:hypothetical protein
MTNKLSVNPFILDTANATDVLIKGPLCIEGIEWLNPANTGDDVEITNANNDLIWSTVAAANNAGSISAGFAPRWVNGLRLTKLDSGKLSIMIG